VDQEGNVTLYETYFDPTFVSFVAACNLTVKACEKVDPTLQVPVGTLQLKVSWRPIRREDPNYERYYTIKDVTCDDPQTGTCVTRDVAMVGFHLVYAPQNHPELVWATTTPPPGFVRWTYNDAKSTDCKNANQLPDMTKQPYPVTQVVRNCATMETFDQSLNPLPDVPPPPPDARVKNCFSCHNTTEDKNPQPVHVTHSITNAADLRACPWTAPPPSCQATQPKKAVAQTTLIQPLASH